MKRIGTILITTLALFLTGCGDDPPVVNKTAIEKSIHDVEAGMVKAAGSKNAGLFAANYSTDAVMMSPFSQPMKGRDGIRSGMTTVFAAPAFKLDFSSDRIEISSAGDMAASRGSYTMSGTDAATKKVIQDKGSFVMVYRKQTDATWKAVLDIATSEVAPAPPAAPKSTPKAAAKKGKKKR